MSPAQKLRSQLALPVIAAPMFIVSNPSLVIAQCESGVVGSFPALNARPAAMLEEWVSTIETALAERRRVDPGAKVAPFAVNQIIHQSNDRLDHDLDVCMRHRVPIIITSLRAPDDVVKRVHEYGGMVFHDVISIRHARKALEAGVDGLVLVCAGAGGHAGMLNPFALVREVRRFFDGPIALSGAITDGAGILAAEAIGADFAYIGTRFIATQEANAVAGYKEMIVDSAAADIVYTPFFSGVHGNYLKKSVAAAGLDPDRLPVADKASMSFASDRPAKVWKDIWGAGQGVGNIDQVLPARELVARLQREYAAARAALAAKGAIGVEAAWSPPPVPPIHTGAAMPLIDLLPSDATLTQILPGHVVFAQGDPGSIMYVLIEGEAQVLLDGKVVETVRQGGILGEMALIDSGPRSATAIAKTRCVLVPIDERRFNDLVRQRPEFALEVMRSLVHRLRRMDVER